VKKTAGPPPEKIVIVKGRRFLFRVEDSDAPADYLKYETLRDAIWQCPEDSLPGGRNMMCENFLHDGGSLFIGVFAADEKGVLSASGERLVGFSYGYVGLKDKSAGFRSPRNLQFYSQYNGVREDHRGLGLGIRLKEFQGEQVRRRLGIATITCTYDPLTAVNAHRNIRLFGMKVLGYREDIYGEFGGLLNRLDVPRDRFFVSWDPGRGTRRPRLYSEKWISSERCVIEAERLRVRGTSGEVELEVVRNVRPAPDKGVLLVEIPADFYVMLRETDVEDRNVRKIPIDWRIESRRAFQGLLEKGYRVRDFVRTKAVPRRHFYVLEKRGELRLR
jgi:predicted GNAT superfamily acetyltransferase